MSYLWYIVNDENEVLTSGHHSRREAVIEYLENVDDDIEVDNLMCGISSIEHLSDEDIKNEE